MELIIIIILSFVAATISGVAGFGGGLILLPLLTYFVSPKVAIPMLTIAQLFGNGSRVFFSYKELRWKPIIFFLIGAIPLAIMGSRMLVSVNAEIVKISIAIFLILVVIYKRWFKDTFQMNYYLLIPGGMLTGFISGLIGSAGPIGAVLFLGLKLPPLAYISSEAFTALSMHFIKIIVYNKYELLDQKTIHIGFLAGLAMVAGSYAGKAIINKIPKTKINLVIEVLLVVSAVQLIIG